MNENEFDFDGILEEVRTKGKDVLEGVNLGRDEGSGEASNEACKRVMLGIKSEAGEGATPFHTFAATAILLQRGATSPRTPGQTKFSFGSATVSVETVRKCCRKERITVRQFARGMKSEIMQFLLALGDQAPDGNQSKNMRLELRNVSKEEAVWASDFNTYNEECPERVKNWLLLNYRKRFRTEI